MKFALGFLAGVGTAWSALAIWQHLTIPEPPADPDDLDEIVYGLEPGREYRFGGLEHLMPEGARRIPSGVRPRS